MLIKINGISIFIIKNVNISVLEAIKLVGITIPRFCYHETLSISGNCRMCLVELLNSRIPIVSCAINVIENMQIFTETPQIKKARENVLELLLLNHPMDCPICDQGGECDLQDQAKVFGIQNTRLVELKRGVEDKYCGLLIKTIMTRCIHCTRCVRFNNEFMGYSTLGILSRGENSEIGNYLEQDFNSELVGNLIDICPVGALTGKHYSFKVRPWETHIIESIDTTDGFGSNILLILKGSEILRIIPKKNSELNNTIISDKVRFSYDALKINRLIQVFLKNIESLKYENYLWEDLVQNKIFFLSKIKFNNKILFLINADLDLDSLIVLKSLVNLNPENFGLRVFNKTFSPFLNFYKSWECSSFLKIQESINSSLGICFACNLRFESSILNSKLRLKINNSNFKIFETFAFYNSNIPINFINLNIFYSIKILEGTLLKISFFLLKSKSPIICIGESLLNRGFQYQQFFEKFVFIQQSLLFLKICLFSNSEALNLFGILNLNHNSLKYFNFIWFIGLEENQNLSFKINQLSSNIYILWMNYFGSPIANKAHIIFPQLTPYESEQIFINMEQRPQKTLKALSTSTKILSLRQIVNIYNKKDLVNYSYNYIYEIIKNPSFYQELKTNLIFSFLNLNQNLNLISLYPIKPLIENYYQTNNFTKKSKIMLTCLKKKEFELINFN